MKKISFLILVLGSVLFGNLLFGQSYPNTTIIDNSSFISSGNLQNVPLDGNLIYLNDGSNFMQMDLNNPSTATNIIAGSAIEGDFDDNGILYYVSSTSTNSAFYMVDLDLGTKTLIGNLNGPGLGAYSFIVSMSYYRGKMYATFSNFTISDIFTIDLATAYCTKVNANPISGFYTVLAINGNGVFFGINADNTNLYQIDPITGTTTLIGYTGLQTDQLCDADFNSLNNNLYFIGHTNKTQLINTSDASTTALSGVGGNIIAVGSPSSSETVPLKIVYVLGLFGLIVVSMLIKRKFI